MSATAGRSAPAASGRAATGGIPWQLLLPAAAGAAILVLPVAGLLLRTPWLRSRTALASLRCSMHCV